MIAAEATVSVLIGPTCPACASHDLRWTAPLGAVQYGQCRECGTEYHWSRCPGPNGDEIRTGAMCPDCGVDQGNNDLCEDCAYSDCVFCGIAEPRYRLSENLACRACEEGLS